MSEGESRVMKSQAILLAQPYRGRNKNLRKCISEGGARL